MNLTPLAVCEALIAPIEELATIHGAGPKAGYNWRKPAATRPAGFLPYTAALAILDYSDQRGLGLTAVHLLRGASEADVQSILASRKQAA